MKQAIFTYTAAAALFLFTGCGSSSSGTDSASLELESDGKTLFFYSASTNEQYAFDVDTQQVTDLNSATDAEGNDIANFNLSGSEQGRLFVWVDDKGDTNASNDEDKILMFHQDYDFATDGNATWEDFYYLGHFHEHEENGVTTNELAAHSNDEFNVTSGAKSNAMIRLNTYLQSQETLKTGLASLLPADANGICAYLHFENEEGETKSFVMGRNGTLYVYDENNVFQDSVAIASGCTATEIGISETEDGVLVFDALAQKVNSVDSHEDGVYHIHTSWDVSELIGGGHSAQMMVGIEPLITE